MQYAILVLVFILLSPGVILRIPAKGPLLTTVLVHAIVFAGVLYLLSLSDNEGFANCTTRSKYTGLCTSTRFPSDGEMCGTMYATNGSAKTCWSNKKNTPVDKSCIDHEYYGRAYKNTCPVTR
jgi:hypothetical protein